MAYCRFEKGKSEAYIIGTATVLECLGCRLQPSTLVPDHCYMFYTTSRTEMIKHMQEHRQRGQKVPFYATRRLRREIKKLGDEY